MIEEKIDDIYFNSKNKYSEEEKAEMISKAGLLSGDSDFIKHIKVVKEKIKACPIFREKYLERLHERKIYESGVFYGRYVE